MTKLFATAAAVVAAAVVSISASAQSKPTPFPKAPKPHASVPGQFVVTLNQATKISPMAFSDLERELESRIKDVISDDSLLVERVNKEARSTSLRSLRNNPLVKAADPNYILTASRTPNDADYKKLWGMNNAGDLLSGKRGLKGVDISAERAWEKSTGSKNVIVGVIDTGIDFKHPDLAPNAWVNEKELNGLPGVDDDGNGYIDDVHGFNFVSNKGDATDDNGHGSHCAGTIGAKGDDGVGVAGVNWDVSLMAIKFLDVNGSGTLANAIKAIDYGRKNGAHILSNSWGGGPFMQTLYDAIDATRVAGQLFVAAAGNDGADNDNVAAYPSNYDIDNIISVAALDLRGDLADFSNYGKTKVDIAAPGVEIYSTVPGGYDSYSGTSMATPHVSGVAALLLADNSALTYQELKQRLFSSARPLRTLQGKVATGGLLDAHFALTGEPVPQDPNDVSTWSEKSALTIASPHPYPDAAALSFTVQVPGAKRLSAHFAKFETEANYDTVTFKNAAGEILGVWSGEKSGEYSPIADGDTLILEFKSDSSVNAHGFEIDSASVER